MTEGKVLGFGAAILDILSRVDDDFLVSEPGGKGGMELVDESRSLNLLSRLPNKKIAPGGSTGNTLAGLLRLGVSVRMLGKVGRDAEGESYRKRFSDLGGDISAFKISEKTGTGCCVCLVTPDSQRTMRTFLGASSEFSASDFCPADLDKISLLHIEGYQLCNQEFLFPLLNEAKKRNITISFDLASYEIVRTYRKQIEQILREYADIVFANEDEAAELMKPAAFIPETALEYLSAQCGTAVVKLGKKGAMLSRNGETVSVPAVLTDAVDTTGAGDLWQAGFLYGYLTGCSLAVCGKMGAVLGSEVVRVLGASIPEDRWPVIKETFKHFQG